MAPAATYTCSVTLPVGQTHFDAREASDTASHTVEVTVGGTSNVASEPFTTVTATQAGLVLPVSRTFTVNSVLSETSVSVTGECPSAGLPSASLGFYWGFRCVLL
jgi:hypothetical protein